MTDAGAIIGVGATAYERTAAASPLEMVATAVKEAVADAGGSRSDIDGLVVNVGSPRGVDYDVVCERLGLSVRYCVQTWAHGRWAATCIAQAVMAVQAGMASTVAVVRASKSSKRGQFGGRDDAEGAREGGGPHGELPHYGLTAPASGAAMAARLYMERYGVADDALGGVAITTRRHAALNPRAIFSAPISAEEYRDSPLLIEPLRRHDFSVAADGAVCILVTSADRAGDADRPVLISGMQGVQAGPEEFVFARPGLGVQQQTERSFAPGTWDTAALRMAGAGVDEVDAFYTYDAFSPLVWFALERFGFCGEGEAADFCLEGHTALGGRLPTNTNGGLLSEGHLSGFNHLREMVDQLRGEAGPRQIADIHTTMWGSCFGDALVLTGGPR
jgi:acetyl-CoA acetyltransferase